MIYECAKCGKKFNHNSNYKTHLNKKYPCKPCLIISTKIPIYSANNPCNFAEIISDSNEIPQFEIEPCFDPNLIFNKIDNPMNNVIDSDQIIDPTQKNKIKKIKKIKKEFRCEYCLKILSRSDVLQNHINNHCKVKKNNDIAKENNDIMKGMKNEIMKLQEICTKLKEDNISMKSEMMLLREIYIKSVTIK